MTKQQAFEILGLNEDDINSNDMLQKMLEKHYNINQGGETLNRYSMSQLSQVMNHQLSRQVGYDIYHGSSLSYNSNFEGTTMIRAVQDGFGPQKVIKIRNFKALFDKEERSNGGGEHKATESVVSDSFSSSHHKPEYFTPIVKEGPYVSL